MIKSFSIFAMFTTLGLPAAVMGSAYLSKLETKAQLKNHQACLAELRTAYAAHQKQVSPKVVADDGSTREVILRSRTGGVEIISPSEARYEGQITFIHGTVRRDSSQIHYQDSWTEEVMRCQGKTLISGGAQGFSSGTFVPLVEPAH